MLRGTFYLFLALCSYASGAKSSILILNNYFPENQARNHIFDRRMFQQVISINKENSEIQSTNRIKRGIVIVDEDFDVPPGSIRNEKDLKSNEDFEVPTGSIENEKDLNSNEDLKTLIPPGSIRNEKDLKTNELFGYTGYEPTAGGSGDKTDDSEHAVTTSGIEIHPKTKSNDSMTEKTSVHEFTKAKLESTTTIATPILVTNDLEGSGDNALQHTKEYSTTEKITTEPAKETYEPIPDICLNTTCSSNDLRIHFIEMSNLIPEGKNFTFSCISNNSDNSMLFWYKSNGSIHFLKAFGREQVLLLNVPDTRTIHSGMYMCVKWISKESCCNLETHLTVYEVPQYTYHLIILALLTLACLLICIFLAVRHSLSIKKYTEQFAQKHGSVKQQLL